MVGKTVNTPRLDPPPLIPDNEWVEKLSSGEVRQFLAEETLFRSVPSSAVDRLAALARQKLVPKGHALFSMGQACEALHFVADGCGLLVKVALDGRERILHHAIRGEMIGAVPFFDGKGYPASFVAESACLVLSLPRSDLLDLFRADPDLCLSIIGGVVARLRMMSSKVEQMSFEDTTERLWDYLVEGSTSDGKEYPRVFERLPTREYIAHLIGTVREVVSRRLSRLADSGHIKVEGRRLTLLRPLK